MTFRDRAVQSSFIVQVFAVAQCGPRLRLHRHPRPRLRPHLRLRLPSSSPRFATAHRVFAVFPLYSLSLSLSLLLHNLTLTPFATHSHRVPTPLGLVVDHRVQQDLLALDQKVMTDDVLYDLLKMGILDWSAPNDQMNQMTPVMRHATAMQMRMLAQHLNLEDKVTLGAEPHLPRVSIVITL